MGKDGSRRSWVNLSPKRVSATQRSDAVSRFARIDRRSGRLVQCPRTDKPIYDTEGRARSAAAALKLAGAGDLYPYDCSDRTGKHFHLTSIEQRK